MSLSNYQSTLRNITEEPKSHSQRVERLKSRKMKTKEQDENRNTALKQMKNCLFQYLVYCRAQLRNYIPP